MTIKPWLRPLSRISPGLTAPSPTCPCPGKGEPAVGRGPLRVEGGAGRCQLAEGHTAGPHPQLGVWVTALTRGGLQLTEDPGESALPEALGLSWSPLRLWGQRWGAWASRLLPTLEGPGGAAFGKTTSFGLWPPSHTGHHANGEATAITFSPERESADFWEARGNHRRRSPQPRAAPPTPTPVK